MGKPATRDEILDQIRRLPLEDRDYIEAELLRDGYEEGRQAEDPAQMAEIVRRANDSLAGSGGGLSREDAVARARGGLRGTRSQVMTSTRRCGAPGSK